MHRLIIVSNRLPVSISKRKGDLFYKQSVGGLATGLKSFSKTFQSLWIGWPGINSEKLIKKERDEIRKKIITDSCYPVFLTKRDIENYYYGFSNKTIWPLFHYFTQHTRYIDSMWKAYKRVNKLFCNGVIKVAKPGDIIWIHDYHLMLLPKLLRKELPKASIGFFLHIPFPSFEVFRLPPWRKDILEGLLGADLIGFHTYDYVQHFLHSVRNIIGLENTFGLINFGNRLIKVDCFPMGIDYEKYASATRSQEIQKEIKRIRDKVGRRKIILSVDRLDYTKGIPGRLEAFDHFLSKYPEYKEKVTLVLVAVPSRTKVEQYKNLKKHVDELIGRINGKYGTINWMPVWYLYRSLPFDNLIAMYCAADIALITPIRDGMNLIAKEYIATKNDKKGVLILSEMAGGAKELGEAIIINPNNQEEIASALKEALTMSNEEQKEHNKIMQERLQRYNIERWANDFMDSVFEIKKNQQSQSANIITKNIRQELIDRYIRAKSRLILLDYDGTLIPFSDKPEKVKPDKKLKALLKNLDKKSKNDVVIISGRDKEILESWFGNIDIALIAEHGVWIKEKNKDWKLITNLSAKWKKEIRQILDFYVDKTPGSFIEEKSFSLVWHYRKADPELSSLRAAELKESLIQLTTNLNIDILEGNKVIEVKNANVNKGRAAQYWVSEKKWDFILSIGDDLTDEDVFNIIPDTQYSIKVGLGPSKALYNLKSVEDVRSFLEKLAVN